MISEVQINNNLKSIWIFTLAAKTEVLEKNIKWCLRYLYMLVTYLHKTSLEYCSGLMQCKEHSNSHIYWIHRLSSFFIQQQPHSSPRLALLNICTSQGSRECCTLWKKRFINTHKITCMNHLCRLSTCNLSWVQQVSEISPLDLSINQEGERINWRYYSNILVRTATTSPADPLLTTFWMSKTRIVDPKRTWDPNKFEILFADTDVNDMVMITFDGLNEWNWWGKCAQQPQKISGSGSFFWKVKNSIRSLYTVWHSVVTITMDFRMIK